jgi:hypothetical protein
MFWSLAPLVLACVVLAGLVGMCSFRPNGPADGAIPTYDAAAALQDDANALNFPIRLPALPAGWQSNSGTRTGIEAGRTDPGTGERQRAVVARVGYIAPSKMYVSLTQSNADETALVASIQKDVYPSGTEDVVRTYAEARTQALADALEARVAECVHRLGGGVGEAPKR